MYSFNLGGLQADLNGGGVWGEEPPQKQISELHVFGLLTKAEAMQEHWRLGGSGFKIDVAL